MRRFIVHRSGYRTGLENAAAKVARDQTHAAIGEERIAGRAQHVEVGAIGYSTPGNCLALEARIASIGAEIVGARGKDVAVKQPSFEQGMRGERHAAGVVEIIHVARAVGIDARISGTAADSGRVLQSMTIPAARAIADMDRVLVDPRCEQPDRA